MTNLFLVDTSVWNRSDASAPIRDALKLYSFQGEIAICPPVALELGYSARSLADIRALNARLSLLRMLHLSENTEKISREIQEALWAAGMGRAAGAMDILISATAIEHDATVVHYDGDFEYIARVAPELSQRWIVPRGTVS